MEIKPIHMASCHCGAVQLQLSLYQFNTMTAKHYFCSVCGIYTHHQRRSNPHLFGFNVACLDGVNPYELGEVPVNDGVNHPCDRQEVREGSEVNWITPPAHKV